MALPEMFKSKEKKEAEKSNDEITKTIESWFEARESMLDDRSIQHYISKLFYAAKKERLVYNEDEKTFTYILSSPIMDKDETNIIISMIKIRSGKLKDKDTGKTKDNYELMLKNVRTYCRKDKGEPIEEGYLERIDDDDLIVIDAVITAFFLKAALPQVKQNS